MQPNINKVRRQPTKLGRIFANHVSHNELILRTYKELLPLLLLLLSHLSHVQLCATPQTAAHQAPPSLGFSKQEHWSGLPFPSPALDLLAVQTTLKILLQHHSSKASALQRSAFFIVQFSHPYMTTGKTIALTRQTFVGKVCLCFLICCLGWS